MRDLVHGKDWSATALGARERWPQSLRTLVELCLASSFPTVIFWGPDRVQIYNDGYRVILGGKHPRALGQGASDCWSEIWDVIGPMMTGVFETGEALWIEATQFSVERSGYLEEAFFTFSYTPARDDAGAVGGIFETVSEVTSQIVAHRRLAALRELGTLPTERIVEDACSAAAAILANHLHDVPFALIYVLDEAHDTVTLRGRSGIDAGHGACLGDFSLASGDPWRLAQALGAGAPVVVRDVDASVGPLPGGPWPEHARDAVVLPIERPGSTRPFGFVVAGVSPRRRLDEEYLDFLRFVAQHLSRACSGADAYDQARKRAEVLAELDRAKTAFFSNVSHEFRTPLTLILGPLEDALATPARALGGDGLEAVHRSSLRLLRLVNSLLDFSRIEAGRLHSMFEPTDLSVLTRGLAGSFQSLVDSAGLKLVVDCPALPEPVYVDRSHWEKVVSNLVSNAFKFTFAGEIAVRLRARENQVDLLVTDTGTGIPAHELPRVFDRFHRVEGARGRSFEGTGIGLALVSELVKAHRGSVRVESTVGQGSTFVVSIPMGFEHLPREQVAREEKATAVPSALTPALMEAGQWLRSKERQAPTAEPGEGASASVSALADDRILVADDNADMREYLVRLLGPHWEVDVVEDGRAALASALARAPALVLSDVMMPQMDGVALLRALREDERTRLVPVVLLSARAGEEAVLEGLETGADDYLVKPFSARELLTRVRTHLGMARVRREAAETAKLLAETRATLLGDVERKNKELEAFSYSVSHDLRAPLRAIDGFSQALLEDHADNLDAKGQDYLRRVRAAAQRMGELIDDLIQLSRVERADLHRARVDLSHVASDVAGLLEKSDPERRLEWVVQSGMFALVDARLLRVLFENVLGNAWKFTAKVPSARIECGSLQQDGKTTFFVRDNGAGFNPARAAKLFGAFQRLHSEAEFPGTGIGLATVQRIVSRHGGEVWAQAAVGQGATISFTLPTGE
jgi:signal transduction histidine kinase